MFDPADPPRTWTLEEANDALSRISEVVARAMHATDNLALMVAVETLASEAVLLRDVGSGLIDFAACSPSGRPYWLCWMWGEPEVDSWHWLDAGFAGRTPAHSLPS